MGVVPGVLGRSAATLRLAGDAVVRVRRTADSGVAHSLVACRAGDRSDGSSQNGNRSDKLDGHYYENHSYGVLFFLVMKQLHPSNETNDTAVQIAFSDMLCHTKKRKLMSVAADQTTAL